MLIEVLRYVHGASNEELREPAYLFALGETQAQVQVPGPIALLRAKVANFVDLKQTGRQDGRHLLVLARILPAYLGDLQASAREGRMAERKLVDLLEQLLAVVVSLNRPQSLRRAQDRPAGVLRSACRRTSCRRWNHSSAKRLPRELASK